MDNSKYANKFKNKIVKAQVKLKIAELDRKGFNQYQIAEQVGISQGMVSQYMTIIKSEYRNRTLDIVEAIREERKAQLLDVIRECWVEFERSKRDTVKVVSELVQPYQPKDKSKKKDIKKDPIPAVVADE